jgi:hypothetical protein
VAQLEAHIVQVFPSTKYLWLQLTQEAPAVQKAQLAMQAVQVLVVK